MFFVFLHQVRRVVLNVLKAFNNLNETGDVTRLTFGSVLRTKKKSVSKFIFLECNSQIIYLYIPKPGG